MTVRGRRADGEDYETTQSGTVYWTLSLYIEADRVAETLGRRPDRYVEPSVFRRVQRKHFPSLALANAVDPLMNDIADRETRGQVQEHLLSTCDVDVADLRQADAEIRRHADLIFKMPASASWTTEGVSFQTLPPGMDHDRLVRLRRFWLSHNNGALSYHLSFSHYYGDYLDAAGQVRSGYDPSTYYFLSLLQKLAAPKEYALKPERLQPTPQNEDPYVDVFGETVLDIDPLDNIRVAWGEAGSGEDRPFWPFVKALFDKDAGRLFDRLAAERDMRLTLTRDSYADQLLDLVPFIEVPGLKVPKSRFMFMLHDERFFDRLMPLDPATKEIAPRKRMVQQGCYEPYQEEMRQLIKKAKGVSSDAADGDLPGGGVRLDAEFWDWVCGRREYDELLAADGFARVNPAFVEAGGDSAGNPRWLPISDRERPEDRMADLVGAMQAGDCVQLRPFARHPADDGAPAAPVQHHIPAFAPGRADCLDYLFLAGFNQNIIDFMNQDTSEILDSIDPIYPDSSEQTDERFFVRYANHRAMITYVPKSRSLEIGNDYIGACPYAFLIHVLAMHNEFLARGHEQKTMTRIERIDALVKNQPLPRTEAMDLLERQEAIHEPDRLARAETAINQAKLAEFGQYEQFRYDNPFRYDTERDVFQTLEELRGVSRKTESLVHAIKSLEDHASDLSRRQQREADDKQKAQDDEAARRGQILSFLLGMTGVFGAGQMTYAIGEKAATAQEDGAAPRAVVTFLGRLPADARVGEAILSWTEAATTLALAIFGVVLAWILVVYLAQLIGWWRSDEGRAWRRGEAGGVPAFLRRILSVKPRPAADEPDR